MWLAGFACLYRQDPKPAAVGVILSRSGLKNMLAEARRGSYSFTGLQQECGFPALHLPFLFLCSQKANDHKATVLDSSRLVNCARSK
jgi:hypothetical protein